MIRNIIFIVLMLSLTACSSTFDCYEVDDLIYLNTVRHSLNET